jgi:hypothetical protein
LAAKRVEEEYDLPKLQCDKSVDFSAPIILVGNFIKEVRIVNLLLE